ncbi:Uncharacterized protein DAT39_001328, partial [Clarias magur]
TVKSSHSVSCGFSSLIITRSIHPASCPCRYGALILHPHCQGDDAFSVMLAPLRLSAPILCLLQHYINYYSGGLKCARP